MTEAAKTEVAKKEEHSIVYMPMGEAESITLTITQTRRFLTTPTKKGVQPSDEQVVKFMMLCKAQLLNPWVGDAFLIGYDGKSGAEFSLITAHQAFLKRSETNPAFDGLEGGITVLTADQKVERRDGQIFLQAEQIIGAWARCYRTDRKFPTFIEINRRAYDQFRSRWKTDPAGMIVKCAKAAALREAFPTQLGGLYTEEEMSPAVPPAERNYDKVGPDSEKASPAITGSTLQDAAASGSAPETEKSESPAVKPGEPTEETPATQPDIVYTADGIAGFSDEKIKRLAKVRNVSRRGRFNREATINRILEAQPDGSPESPSDASPADTGTEWQHGADSEQAEETPADHKLDFTETLRQCKTADMSELEAFKTVILDKKTGWDGQELNVVVAVIKTRYKQLKDGEECTWFPKGLKSK